MPRTLRIEYEGAIYHGMSRGDRREPIFRDDQDRLVFLETLGEVCAKTDGQVQAVCLMGNHFHLVVETLRANLVAGMKWFLGTYTQRFNRRHRLSGHLFSGQYKAVVIDGNSPWLRVGRLLGAMGLPKDSGAARRELKRQMEAGRREGGGKQEWDELRRGWFFGDEALKNELLAQASERVGAQHDGLERQESGAAKAERLVGEEFRKRRWTEEDLEQRRKGDPGEVRMARRLRQETTMTLEMDREAVEDGDVDARIQSAPLSERRTNESVKSED